MLQHTHEVDLLTLSNYWLTTTLTEERLQWPKMTKVTDFTKISLEKLPTKERATTISSRKQTLGMGENRIFRVVA